MATDAAPGDLVVDQRSAHASASVGMGLSRPGTVVGAPARTVFGQAMGLIAVTTGFSALGAYLGRNLTGGTGILFFIAAFACVFGLQFATARGHQQLASSARNEPTRLLACACLVTLWAGVPVGRTSMVNSMPNAAETRMSVSMVGLTWPSSNRATWGCFIARRWLSSRCDRSCSPR